MTPSVVASPEVSEFEVFGIAPPTRKPTQSETVKLWFDAQPALGLFFQLQTQWRIGFAGRTGLDYTAVLAVLALHCPHRAKQRALLAEIAALEAGVLRADATLHSKT